MLTMDKVPRAVWCGLLLTMATGSARRGAVAPGLGCQAKSREAAHCAGAAVDHFNERSDFSAQSKLLHRCNTFLHMLQGINSACMFFMMGMAGLLAPLILSHADRARARA